VTVEGFIPSLGRRMQIWMELDGRDADFFETTGEDLIVTEEKRTSDDFLEETSILMEMSWHLPEVQKFVTE
jgi:hypothetical protein